MPTAVEYGILLSMLLNSRRVIVHNLAGFTLFPDTDPLPPTPPPPNDLGTITIVVTPIEVEQSPINATVVGKVYIESLWITPAEVEVRVYAIELNGEKLLGTRPPSFSDGYSIPVHIPEIPSLFVVRAYNNDGIEIGHSPYTEVRRELPEDTTNSGQNRQQQVFINVTIESSYEPTTNEFHRYNTVRELYISDEAFAEATEEQLRLLALRTSLTEGNLSILSRAYALSDAAATEPEILYGLFRQGVPYIPMNLSLEIIDTIEDRLNTAAEEKIISEEILAEADYEALATYFRGLLVTGTLEEPVYAGGLTLGEVLDTYPDSSPGLRDAVALAYWQFSGDTETFWEQLGTEYPEVSSEVEGIRYTFQSAALSLGSTPVLHHLQQLRDDETVESLSDFVDYALDDWEELIDDVISENTGVDIFPEMVPGENETEKKQALARAFSRIIEHTYPTPFLTTRLHEALNNTFTGDLVTFMGNNTSFDLGSNSVGQYLEDNPGALSGISNAETFTAELKVLQNQYLLSPGFERHISVQALKTIGVHSSHDVASQGWNAFSGAYTAAGGSAQIAGATYEMATRNQAFLQNFIMRYGVDLRVSAYALGHSELTAFVKANIANEPNLETLFGSQDYCECRHCRSIYSPAAYLVDVFKFLDEIKASPSSGSKTCLDVLMERRRDLKYILLNCENAETPLPYVDLLNEIMEVAAYTINETQGLSGGALETFYANLDNELKNYQTTGLPAELQVHPERIRDIVYGSGSGMPYLGDAIYPWKLPFDLHTETGRAYLAHLRLKRYTLMDAFYTGEDTIYTDEAIANEVLHITPAERDLLTSGTYTGLQIWGLSSGALVNTVKVVDTLLDRSGLSYEELKELLKTHYVNPGKEISGNLNWLAVQFDEDNQCDLNHAKIAYREGVIYTQLQNTTDDPVFLRLARFCRQRQRLGWSIRELDIALKTFGFSDNAFTDAILAKLAVVERVRQQVNKPLAQLLPLWGNIFTGHQLDAKEDRSPYTLLFQNKMVQNPVDLAFALNTALSEVNDDTEPLSDHWPALRAALGISMDDLQYLSSYLELSDAITLANLSALYRYTFLAKTLRCSIRQLIRLKDLLGIDPFDGDHPGNTLMFIERYNLAKAAKISVEELAYWQEATHTVSEGYAPETKTIITALSAIRKGLLLIQSDNAFVSDPTGELTSQKLNVIFTEKLTKNIAIYIRTLTSSDPEITVTDLRNHLLTFIPLDAHDEFDDYFPEAPNMETDPPMFAERFDFILSYLLPHVEKLQRENFIVQTIAELLRLEPESARILLQRDTFQEDTDPDIVYFTLLEILSSDNSYMDEEEEELLPGEYASERIGAAYIKIHKLAGIVSRLRIRTDQLELVLAGGLGPSWAGWIDPLLIPATSDDTSYTGLSATLLDLYELLKLSASFPLSDLSLTGVIAKNKDTATAAGFVDDIVLATRWPKDQVIALLAYFAFEPEALLTERPYLVMAKCLRLIKLTGSNTDEITGIDTENIPEPPEPPVVTDSWIANTLTANAARAIVSSIKSLHSDTQWQGIAKEIRDILREQQRDALRTWLLNYQDDIGSENDLYSWYLVDTEMGACTITSRIRLAMSTVQLFVLRCQMNLEPDVVISQSEKETWDQWKWMKRYRVWEANRKVFTYPENWIEPELRDDKSEFFRELEEELAQVEINENTVNKAYLNYLGKLEAVSTMEIMGICRIPESHSYYNDAYYVFGRRIGKPTNLYFRKKTSKSEGRHWTPWEKIDMDFEGDHLIPIVANNKLYLFWPVFQWRGQDIGEKKPPLKTAIIQMAWSEYHNGSWSPRRISAEKILENRDKNQNENIYGWWTVDERSINAPGGEGRFFFSKFHSSGRDTISIYAFHRNWSMEDREMADESMQFWQSSYHRIGRFEFDLSTKQLKATNTDLNGQPINMTEWTNVDALFYADDYMGVYDRLGEQMWVMPQVLYQWQTDARASVRDAQILRPSPKLSVCDRLVFNKASSYKCMFVNEFTRDDSNVDIMPFVYKDAKRSFYFSRNGAKFEVENFYHPYVKDFIKIVNLHGVEMLLDPVFKPGDSLLTGLRRQQASRNIFASTYQPTNHVATGYPVEDIDFSYKGAYSIYNWELFFHIPVFIAGKLSQNQQFDEARKWYQYIFDPTDTSGNYPIPQRFWKIKPFVQLYEEEGGTPASVNELMLLLSQGNSEMEEQVDEWRKNPFNPHLVARNRISAYQKNVVMKYIDNLLAWGDMLFRQDTIESNNEAAQLYMLAWYILGERPRKVDGKEPADKCYADLQDSLDAFGNAMVTLENRLMRHFIQVYTGAYSYFGSAVQTPNIAVTQPVGVTGIFSDALGLEMSLSSERIGASPSTSPVISSSSTPSPIPNPGPPIQTIVVPVIITSLVPIHIQWENGHAVTHSPERYKTVYTQQVLKGLYFCIPHNDKLTGYWDLVADRLYKLRHCMDIEGRFRQLALFDPPIDPAMLVRAAAAGLDIGSVISDLFAPLSNYRFSYMLAKAKEFTAAVKGLGQALLGALEKRDAESMALLRAVHEQDLLKAMTEMKKNQVKEAETNIEASTESLNMANQKAEFYGSREKIIEKEKKQIDLMKTGLIFDKISFGIHLSSALASLIPDGNLGASGAMASPVVTLKIGGTNFGPALTFAANALSSSAKLLYQQASISGILASFDRRQEDWDFQKALADTEIKMIEKQIVAADIRKQIAETDLQNHQTTIEQREAEYDFMRSKFTNEALYNWMITQLSVTYFQAYQLAYKAAQQAQRCFAYELPDTNDNYISFGYWDSLKKGLLSAEKLENDLLRMEAGYMEKNRRTYELTKHVSLAMLSPAELLKLRETGICEINIPEELFDLDYPGHYMRRIKSVSISIPCVAGPYTGVSATLTLGTNSIRKVPTGDTYAKDTVNGDNRFIDNIAAIQSIATSTGQNDSGMFNLNFNDERYLPFEGAGAVSNWRLQLPAEFRSFDYDTISDVILTLSYTAKEGGGILRGKAVGNLTTLFETAPGENPLLLSRLFSVKHEFGNEWHQFLNPVGEADPATVLTLLQKHFPFYLHDKTITIAEIIVFALPSGEILEDFEIAVGSESEELELLGTPNATYGSLQLAVFDTLNIEIEHEGTEIHLKGNDKDWSGNVEDVFLLVKYTA